MTALTDITHAKKIFQQILLAKGIANRGMFDRDNNLNNAFLPIKSLDDPFAWLPVWMLKSDELAVAITGSRLWSVYYKIDDNTLENIAVMNEKDVEEQPSSEIIETYNKFNVINESSLEAMRLKICDFSIRQTLYEKGKSIDIRPVSLSKAKNLKSGDFIPFPGFSSIIGTQFQRLITQSNREAWPELTKEADISPQL